ncbi:MAG TPA: hypothetical protein DGU45_01770 [Planctomycetes bacterium]|nr:hypothetical protein [Planctomycetota bacterium]
MFLPDLSKTSGEPERRPGECRPPVKHETRRTGRKNSEFEQENLFRQLGKQNQFWSRSVGTKGAHKKTH